MKKYLNLYCKSLLVVLFSTFISLSSIGQGTGSKHDKIQNLKIAFISKKLNLSSKSSKEFWPIYNEYDNAKQRLFRKYRRKYQKLSMQDIEHRMEREKEFLDLRKKYINRFAKILTPVQIADLKRSERQFKKLLLKRAKHSH